MANGCTDKEQLQPDDELGWLITIKNFCCAVAVALLFSVTTIILTIVALTLFMLHDKDIQLGEAYRDGDLRVKKALHEKINEDFEKAVQNVDIMDWDNEINRLIALLAQRPVEGRCLHCTNNNLFAIDQHFGRLDAIRGERDSARQQATDANAEVHNMQSELISEERHVADGRDKARHLYLTIRSLEKDLEHQRDIATTSLRRVLEAELMEKELAAPRHTLNTANQQISHLEAGVKRLTATGQWVEAECKRLHSGVPLPPTVMMPRFLARLANGVHTTSALAPSVAAQSAYSCSLSFAPRLLSTVSAAESSTTGATTGTSIDTDTITNPLPGKTKLDSSIEDISI
ncbi:hypothetical protein NA57DRAFT_82077 [Rhizodiscina lignyota]|uniref:Uncharacterized protein n=1 Tax=Rhizodiscina lignyota TaxID=1504668 RepID=A0A9P4M0P9_9PEZI|nr:hypothetical protein NA57DRAFT_82077 [Rhizodiscina lignyota]